MPGGLKLLLKVRVRGELILRPAAMGPVLPADLLSWFPGSIAGGISTQALLLTASRPLDKPGHHVSL